MIMIFIMEASLLLLVALSGTTVEGTDCTVEGGTQKGALCMYTFEFKNASVMYTGAGTLTRDNFKTNTACYLANQIYQGVNKKIATAEECEDLCTSRTYCTFWNFTPGRGGALGSCSLHYKRREGFNLIKANALAGGAPGGRTGSADHYKITTPDTIGYFQYNKVTLNVSTPAECQKLCAEEQKCITWTYNQKDSLSGLTSCTFDYDDWISYIPVGGPNPNFNVVSGPAVCGEDRRQFKGQNPDDIVGTYELSNGPFNDWHYATVTKKDTGVYTWKNRAGVSWTLTAKGEDTYTVGKDCPYYNIGYTLATLKGDELGGAYSEWFRKV